MGAAPAASGTAQAAGMAAGLEATLVYITIYLAMNLGVFAVLMCLNSDGTMLEDIDDLKGMVKSHSGLSYIFAILMFSMAGIPPLAGFLGKLLILNIVTIDFFLFLIIWFCIGLPPLNLGRGDG